MDELVELFRILVTLQLLERNQPRAFGDEGCGPQLYDLDAMNDLDDGAPYIWNTRPEIYADDQS